MDRIADESSIHGISYILARSQDIVTRILWTFLLLFSFCGFFFYVYQAFVKWQINPDFVEVEIKKPSHIVPFPAITICNDLFARNNLSNIQAVISMMSNGESKADIKNCEFLSANSHWCGNNADIVKWACGNSTDDINVLQLINQSALQVSEIFESCSVDLKLIDCEKMFNKIFTDYGICYSFNMQGFHEIFNENEIHEDFNYFRRTKISKSLNVKNPLYNQSFNDFETQESTEWTLLQGYSTIRSRFPMSAKKSHKISLFLRQMDSDVVNSCHQGDNEMPSSYLFALHLPNEIPIDFFELAYDNFLDLSIIPNMISWAEETKSNSVDDRKCYFEDERKLKFFMSYTVNNCLLECRALYMLEKCGCIKFSLPRDNKTRICGLNDMKCYVKYSVNYICDCYPPCTNINYFAKQYNLESKFALYRNKKNEQNLNFTTAGLEAYIRSEFIVQVQNYNPYSIEQFVAEMGGLLGLFTGCSLLSIFEIFFLLSSSICQKRTQNSTNNQQSPITMTQKDFLRLIRQIEAEEKKHEEICRLLTEIEEVNKKDEEVSNE